MYSALGQRDGDKITHEYEGGVQVIVIFPRLPPTKFVGFLTIHDEEVGTQVVSSQWLEELFEGGMEAVTQGYPRSDSYQTIMWTLPFGSIGRPQALAPDCPWSSKCDVFYHPIPTTCT